MDHRMIDSINEAVASEPHLTRQMVISRVNMIFDQLEKDKNTFELKPNIIGLSIQIDTDNTPATTIAYRVSVDANDNFTYSLMDIHNSVFIQEAHDMSHTDVMACWISRIVEHNDVLTRLNHNHWDIERNKSNDLDF